MLTTYELFPGIIVKRYFPVRLDLELACEGTIKICHGVNRISPAEYELNKDKYNYEMFYEYWRIHEDCCTLIGSP